MGGRPHVSRGGGEEALARWMDTVCLAQVLRRAGAGSREAAEVDGTGKRRVHQERPEYSHGLAVPALTLAALQAPTRLQSTARNATVGPEQHVRECTMGGRACSKAADKKPRLSTRPLPVSTPDSRSIAEIA